MKLRPYGQVNFRRLPDNRESSVELPEKKATHNATLDSVEFSQNQPPDPATLCGTVAAAIPGPLGACCAVLATELSPQDYDGWDKAEAYYDKVRQCDKDVAQIAHHTPYDLQQVRTIKDHLFINEHQLDDGMARFDADPLIANAWSRLSQGKHFPKDLQLMEHELFEARFESLFDTDYRTAHDAANRSGRTSGLYES